MRGGGFGGTGGEISAEDPSGLPWLIKLDKYADDQNHHGVTDFVIRSNGSETSLNEAVALQLLSEAGLATQDAMSVRFNVNGDHEALRLVIEHPDDVWMSDNFDSEDSLYKAESTGDYSYRGEDQDAYDDVFDQEAGKKNSDLGPLIEFLDFINNSDDETFAAELGEHFDVDAFATYLAMQEVVQNFDDIDGPGNNSYLHFDASTGLMTVVPWDYNLAFGGLSGQGGGFDRGNLPEGAEAVGPGGFDPDNLPEGFDADNLPEGADGGGLRGGGGGPGGANILLQRFLNVSEFTALYEQALADQTEALLDSGRASEILSEWVAVLEAEATDLVDLETISTEAAALRSSFG